ncbi:MAG TPA: type II toxin-antitoxin system RelE/ParE family toxin [Terriglobia bacterium]|nr:type II toxin-antitoxin system RelE/ParE family toxin [Terriglobia bacterium]
MRAAARDDILRQFRYYLVDQDKPEVADRFVEAVERTIDQLLRTPNAGAPKHLSNESLSGLRSWPVEGFQDIRIYYLAEENVLRVIRVLHGKRDIRRILEGKKNEGRRKDDAKMSVGLQVELHVAGRAVPLPTKRETPFPSERPAGTLRMARDRWSGGEERDDPQHRASQPLERFVRIFVTWFVT